MHTLANISNQKNLADRSIFDSLHQHTEKEEMIRNFFYFTFVNC